MAWRSLPLLLAFASLNRPAWADVRQVIDLRDPGPGITEFVVEWVGSTGVWPEFVGDVDGDGFQDFLIQDLSSGGNSGPSFLRLVYGFPQSRFGLGLNLDNARQTRFHYEIDHEGFSFWPDGSRPFAGLGDLDGDGHGDFLISAENKRWENIPDTGQVLVIFGARDFPAEVDLDDPSATGLRTLRLFSREVEHYAGRQLSSAGDLNGDGRPDLAIAGEGTGTRNQEPLAGRIHVVFGGFDPGKDIDLDEVGKSVPGFVLRGAIGGAYGSPEWGDALGVGDTCMASAGDLNGDGRDDFLAGALQATRAVLRGGAIYVVYGSPDLDGEYDTFQPETFGVEFQGETADYNLGQTVAGVGDVDGDGLDDFVAGANSGNDAVLGEAWLVYGSRDWPARVRIGDPGLRTLRLRGSSTPFNDLAAFPSLGSAVEGLGDFNGDGFGDFLVTASRQPVRFGTLAGAAYIIFGGPDLPPEARDIDVGTARLPGIAVLGKDSNRYLGNMADAGGDFDGDRQRDLILVSPFRRSNIIPTPPSSIYILSGGRVGRRPLDIVAVEPSSGSIEGGAAATVRGAGFRGGERVLFGGIEARQVDVLSSVEMQVAIPAAPAPIAVDVEVVGTGGESTRLAGGFNYIDTSAHPDLILDPLQLRASGRRTLVFRDFQAPPPPSLLVCRFASVFAGDLNGDGVDDLAIMGANEGALRQGRVSIVLGGSALPEEIAPGEASTYGPVIEGEDLAPGFGISVAFPGDVDGDGHNDLAIGGASTGFLDRTYILFGREVWAPKLRMGRELEEGRAVVFPGRGCIGGSRVAAPGDIDGDGIGDFLVSYNICGGAAMPLDVFQGPLAPGGRLAGRASSIQGVPGPRLFGYDLNSAGDMNGDGLADFLVGSEAIEDPLFGECLIVLGERGGFTRGTTAGDLIAAGKAVRVRREQKLSDFGRVVAPAGDFNGDGLADAFLGAPGGGLDFQGEVHVVFGSPELGRSVRELDLREKGPRSLRIDGEDPYDWNGDGAGIGDWNGDGLSDIAIVSTGHRNQRARAYVVFGSEDPPASIDLRQLGTAGFRIHGLAGNWFSRCQPGSVVGGDFDGDGATDLAIGEATPEGKRVVVLFGSRASERGFVRGEVNGDGLIDITDAVRILGYLFLGEGDPGCLDAADVDDSGIVDLSDPVYLLGHLFLGEAAPPAPYPGRGEDPTPDPLGCR